MRIYTAHLLFAAAAMLLSFGYPPPVEAASFQLRGGFFKFFGGSFVFGTYVNPCDSSTVFDDEGNEYTTVPIGGQCWMGENLRIGTRINNNLNQTDNGIIEKYCYDNDDANCTSNNPSKPDGGLYQWNEAMQYVTTPGARGICPAGWHIPTDTELYMLENWLDSSVNDPNATGWRGTNIGTLLKPGGGSGLEFNLTGYRGTTALHGFVNRGSNARVWSSSEHNSSNVRSRNLSLDEARSHRENFNLKTFGFSVRCLKGG